VFVGLGLVVIIILYLRKRHKKDYTQIDIEKPLNVDQDEKSGTQPSDADKDAVEELTQQLIDGATGDQMTHRINNDPISAEPEDGCSGHEEQPGPAGKIYLDLMSFRMIQYHLILSNVPLLHFNKKKYHVMLICFICKNG